MDEKLKIKQEKLIEMVSGFGEEYLDEELTHLCVKLVEKLGRKREVPFKRGKLENWASGIVYAIAQLNFVFDDSFEPYASADDICNYFGTKKSTAANKARDLRKLLHLNLGNKEFSTDLILSLDLSNLGGDLSQVKTLEGAMANSTIRSAANLLRETFKQKQSIYDVENDKIRKIIRDIFDSDGEFVDEALIDDLAYELSTATFISPACGAGLLMLSSENGGVLIPAFTSMNEYNLEFEGGHIGPVSWKFIEILNYLDNDNFEGMVINPHVDDFFVSLTIIHHALINLQI